MNIAISCDSIMARDYTTSVVESVLSLYERAEIYTIVHKAGKVLGPIEQRRIQSTYLSTLINDEFPSGEEWWKKSYLIPGACRNLTVPCNVDVLVNITSGFSQGFERCEGVYQVSYLLENTFNTRKKKSLREKLFSGFVEHWAIKQLKKADELWVTNSAELEFWKNHHDNVSIMAPFFKASDYPIFPAAIRKTFPGDFFCFDAATFNEEQATRMIEKCKSLQLKFKFVGRDEHLPSSLKDKEQENFFGERCSGELAPLLAASRGFISLHESGFPSRVLSALSTGTPVSFQTNSEISAYFEDKEGIFRFDSFSDLLDKLPSFYSSMLGIDPVGLHNQTNKYHDLKFRGEFTRRMKDLTSKALDKGTSANC
jgi:hypothetical protein